MGMLRKFACRFVRDERGAALAEYAAIFLVLATAGTIILVTVGGTLADVGTELNNWLTNNVLTAFQGANAP